ncbi:hypothetical protein D3C84_750030 [compost metagenome]
MQAQDLLRPASHRRDSVDIQRRGVAGQNGFWFEQAVQLAEDFLLELKVFVHRLNDQIDITNGRVIGGGSDPSDTSVCFSLIDTLLPHVVGVGVCHGDQCLLEHLWIVINPLHCHPGVGQAHDNASTHGARANHGCALNIRRSLAHIVFSCWRSKDSPHHSQPQRFFEIYSCDEQHSADGCGLLQMPLGPRPHLGIRIILQCRKPRNRPRLELGEQRHADPAQESCRAFSRGRAARVLLVPVDKIATQRLEVFIHKRRQLRWCR